MSKLFKRTATLITLWLAATLAQATEPLPNPTYPRVVKDLAGRSVTIPSKPHRLFLANPRHLYGLMFLERELSSVTALGAPLSQYDPSMARLLATRFPALASVATIGRSANGAVNIEHLLAQRPDLALFPLSQRASLAGTRLLATLEALGIPYLYIDFHTHPLANTPLSMAVLGQALDQTERAERFLTLYRRHMARLDAAVSAASTKPSVLIVIAPGLKVACCRTNVDQGVADLVKRAGGTNIVTLTHGNDHTLTNEWVLTHPADHIIATAGQWATGSTLVAGANVSRAQTAAGLRDLTQQLPGWRTFPPVRDGHLHALWHGFHQGPFALVALERIATWLHPQTTRGIAPLDTFERFLSLADLDLPDEATFWGSLETHPTPKKDHNSREYTQ